MLFWVPVPEVAAALEGLPGASVAVVAPDGGPLPAGAAEVEFYVPPFFPPQPAVEAMADLPRLRVVQALTAGIDRYLPFLPPGVTLCNARGAHDASTAEWVVAAILAAVRDLPYFALEQAAQRWSYRFTDSLASKTVLIVGYGSIGQAVERRLAGFEVEVSRVARRARDGVAPVSDLPALLPTADVVVILAPVTAETIGMVDAGFLARMRRRRRDRPRAAEPRTPAVGGAWPAHHAARGRLHPGVGGAFGRVRAGSGRTVHRRAAAAERHRREVLTGQRRWARLDALPQSKCDLRHLQ